MSAPEPQVDEHAPGAYLRMRSALKVAQAAAEQHGPGLVPLVHALEAAQLLQSPESAAEVELLRQRVEELEREVRAGRAARDIEIVIWLGKKAREYRSTGDRQHALQADAIELMASKIARGVVPGGAE